MFDEHFAYVWGVLRRLGVRAEDAEDRALEVFVAVHDKLSTFDLARPVRPWLFGFAYRVASHARRGEVRRREILGVDPSLPAPAALPDEQLAAAEEWQLLAAALDTLDLERRAVVVMHDWDDEPMPEVARALAIPLNTAYSRLRLGRADLAAAVKAHQRRRVDGRRG
jgi:RNA polymerase sigma-70 factor (ECF subfamily)